MGYNLSATLPNIRYLFDYVNIPLCHFACAEKNLLLFWISEKYSRNNKNILVICDYYILCKSVWKSCIFIGLQECDILAHERVTNKFSPAQEGERLKCHLLVNQWKCRISMHIYIKYNKLNSNIVYITLQWSDSRFCCPRWCSITHECSKYNRFGAWF